MKKAIMAAVTLTVVLSMCGCSGIRHGENGLGTADTGAAGMIGRFVHAKDNAVEKKTDTPAESSDMKKGTGKFRGLTFTAFCTDADTVRIQAENDSPDSFSFGWVAGSTVTCVTTAGEYYSEIPCDVIRSGEEREFTCYFDNAQGEIETIRISDMYMLKNGLPEGFDGSTADISFSGEDSGAAGETAEEDIKDQDQAGAEMLQGTGNYEGLTIEASGDANRIRVKYTNTGADSYSLGWVQGPTITCTTDTGEYYFASKPGKISPGNSLEETYYFDGASGKLQALTISGIQRLSSGLPADFSGGATVTINFDERTY